MSTASTVAAPTAATSTLVSSRARARASGVGPRRTAGAIAADAEQRARRTRRTPRSSRCGAAARCRRPRRTASRPTTTGTTRRRSTLPAVSAGTSSSAPAYAAPATPCSRIWWASPISIPVACLHGERRGVRLQVERARRADHGQRQQPGGPGPPAVAQQDDGHDEVHARWRGSRRPPGRAARSAAWTPWRPPPATPRSAPRPRRTPPTRPPSRAGCPVRPRTAPAAPVPLIGEARRSTSGLSWIGSRARSTVCPASSV